MTTPTKHSCIKCRYFTDSKQSFNRHIQSVKHKDLNEFKCETCGNYYKHRQSLHRHNKECISLQAHIEPNILNSVSEMIDEKINTQVVSVLEKVIESNNNFQENVANSQHKLQTDIKDTYDKLIDSHNNFVTTVANNNTLLLENVTAVLQNTVKPAIKKDNTSSGFNLDTYLNETCVDAVNIEDFVLSINPTYEDVSTVGNYGYVEGNLEVILKYLKNLEKTKRPLQCSDLKRQTVYMKTQGKWEKDDEELKNVRKIVNRLCHKTYKNKSVWEARHPECENMDSRRGQEFILIIKNTSGNGEDTDVLNEKIAKKLIKSCIIEKMVA